MSEWEVVSGNIYRLRIFNGWLVRAIDAEGYACSVTFVPDPKHEWTV